MAQGAFAGDYAQALRWLEQGWVDSGDGWDDQIRRDFEADYIAPITRAASVFEGQVEVFAAALRQARNEVP